MILNWKPFKIDLKTFYQFLQDNVPNSDGIVAYDSHLDIIESSPLTESEVNLIHSYYDSLTEVSESSKINRLPNAHSKLVSLKLDMISKSYDELSTLERKILLGVELTESDIDELLSL